MISTEEQLKAAEKEITGAQLTDQQQRRTAERSDRTIGHVERITLQEEIKMSVEFLFGSPGFRFAYERLRIHEHIDEQLDAMEQVELLAIHEATAEMLDGVLSK